MVLRALGVALISSLILTGVGGALVVTNTLGLSYNLLSASFEALICTLFGPLGPAFFGTLDALRAGVLALVGLPLLFVGRALISRCLRAITVAEIGMIDTAAWPAAEAQLRGLARSRRRAERRARKAGRLRAAGGARTGSVLIT